MAKPLTYSEYWEMHPFMIADYEWVLRVHGSDDPNIIQQIKTSTYNTYLEVFNERNKH